MYNLKRMKFVNEIILFIIIFISLQIYNAVVVAQEKGDPWDPTWSTALNRRTVPLEAIETQGESVQLLKLFKDTVVLTAIGGTPERDLIYLLGEGCRLSNHVIINDAVILLPKEKAENFARNNLQFTVLKQESENFRICAKPGMMSSVVQRYEQRTVYKSKSRLASLLNKWAEFFGLRKKQIARAIEFVNISLQLQTGEIRSVANSSNVELINYVISFFDESHPLLILGLDKQLTGLNKNILKEYLQTIVDNRGKLIANYPEHRQKLSYEKELLKKISAQ